ncbi:hypothetical protein LG331_09215 [Vreelandella aquamarina]|uniref:hypothetical protein n=1 Tax=Vreelandella aquamarina TaxID=77097 RepID=UPI00384DA4FD
MRDVLIQLIQAHQTAAGFQCFRAELELTQLFMQRQHHLVIVQLSNHGWQPMMTAYQDHLSCSTALKRFPWGFMLQFYVVAVASKKIFSESSVEDKCGSFPNFHIWAFFLDLFLALIKFISPHPCVVHSLYIGHAVFLLLVDGVATNTLAGFGVAFYKWEAV